MDSDSMVKSTWCYMETEDVYGSEEQSDLEKAIEADAAELEPQLQDRDVCTQQSVAGEHRNSDDDVSEVDRHSDGEVSEVASDFVEENDQQPSSINDSKDASEAKETCGSTDETERSPYIGMEFVDLDAAYAFYNNYARMKGFAIRIDHTQLSRKRESDGSRRLLSKRYVCYKEGFRNDKNKRDVGKSVRHREEVRVGCPALLRVKTAPNGWVVDKFEDNHNHSMVPPGQTIRLRSHQHLRDEVKLIVDNLQGTGLGPTKIFDVVADILGGSHNIGVSEGTLKGYMKRNERKKIASDCKAVLSYFESMKVRDPGFIYFAKVSNDGTFSGLFWADKKARLAYEVFGDVVVFDTTCKKNRYRWPFGSFTGVNHHAQSILFGCGLVANERKESFEWLFKALMNAMGDKAPKAIITDECTGIIPAVSSVFPKTAHRFCSWHVSKHAVEHLGPLWDQNPDFKKEWKQCIYRSWTEEDFLASWESMMVKYNLKENFWLSDKFSQKKCWVPCYFRGTFFAGMSSTRRSEEMNSYFQGYFKDGLTLYRFIKQYERAVARRREKEADAEVKTFTQFPSLSTQIPLEEHAAGLYTRRLFEIFKKHFNASLCLSAHEETTQGPVRKFKVGPFKVPFEERCVVEYNSVEEEVHCSCRMFEFMGLLCKHALKVLQMVDRETIPSKYILFRWTNEAISKLPVDYLPENAPTSITTKSLRGLTQANRKMMAIACSSQEGCEFAMGKLQELTEELNTIVQNATGVGVGDSTIGTQKASVESMCKTH